MNLFSLIVGLLHGDMDQSGRNSVITEFKRKIIPIMVATDVAGMSCNLEKIMSVIL